MAGAAESDRGVPLLLSVQLQGEDLGSGQSQACGAPVWPWECLES